MPKPAFAPPAKNFCHSGKVLPFICRVIAARRDHQQLRGALILGGPLQIAGRVGVNKLHTKSDRCAAFRISLTVSTRTEGAAV
jgi:hypothetical protein